MPEPRRETVFEFLTAPGPAAICSLRIVGPRVAEVLAKHVRLSRDIDQAALVSRRTYRAQLLDEAGEPFDDVLVSIHSTEPTWDVRLHMHGNPWIARQCAAMFESLGLRETSADLTLWDASSTIEAEVWRLLPRIVTIEGARWLASQIEALPAALRELLARDDFEAARACCAEIADRRRVVDWLITPLRVALVGPPNAGKSTLANALTNRTVSLVSARAGTTRDFVEAPGQIDGFPVTWLDTAGLRESGDALECAGIDFTHRIIEAADAAVVVLDATDAASEDRRRFVSAHGDLRPGCIALNKSDIAQNCAAIAAELPQPWSAVAISVSAETRCGLDDLCGRVQAHAGRFRPGAGVAAACTARQEALLRQATCSDRKQFRDIVLRLIGPR